MMKKKSPINGTVPDKKLFDLALWFSGTMCEPGECLSQHEIARNVSAAMKVLSGKDRGISAESIRRIEMKAMRKARAYYYRNKELRQELEGLFGTPNDYKIRNRQHES